MVSDNENTWAIVTDNKGITFGNDKIPLKEHYNGGLTMTYEEAYLNCKNKEEFIAMIDRDTKYAVLFNRDRLDYIEKAVNEACRIHPDWSD